MNARTEKTEGGVVRFVGQFNFWIGRLIGLLVSWSPGRLVAWLLGQMVGQSDG